MLKSAIILVLISLPLYGQEKNSSTPIKPSGGLFINPSNTYLIRRPEPTPEEAEESPRESGYSFSSGVVGGQRVQTETIQYGNLSFTSGTVGDKPINVTTYSIDSDDDED